MYVWYAETLQMFTYTFSIIATSSRSNLYGVPGPVSQHWHVISYSGVKVIKKRSIYHIPAWRTHNSVLWIASRRPFILVRGRTCYEKRNGRGETVVHYGAARHVLDRRAEEHLHKLVQRSLEGNRREGLWIGDRLAGWADVNTAARGAIKAEEVTRKVSYSTMIVNHRLL